jgi:hypothetical protein
MRKTMATLVALVGLATSATLTLAACDSPTAQPTGCVASYPSSGSMAGVVCDIGWSCSDDTQHYQLLCTESDGNYSCTCTTDTTTAVTVVVVTPFKCTGTGAQPAAIGGCLWDIQE